MRYLALTLVFGFAAGVAHAQENDANLVTPQSDWRKALDSSYKFVGPTGDLPSTTLSQSPESFAANDATTVIMPPFIVRESKFDYNSLHSAIQQSEEGVRKAEIASKLGIGIHEIKGKRFTFGAVTIFYIPVAFGIKW